MPHGDNHRITAQHRAIDHDARDGSILGIAGNSLDAACHQPGAVCNRRRHHGVGKGRRVDLRRGGGGAQLAVYGGPLTQPVRRGQLAVGADVLPGGGDHAQCFYRSVAPICFEIRRQPLVQGEAAPRQGRQGRAIAPIQGQEPA